MKILVCGFMGSGKTTFVERMRPNQMGYKVFDLDERIAHSLGISPLELGEWITRVGLDVFRQKEVEVLGELFLNTSPLIIALGGGTIEAPGFWELKEKAKLVFLATSFETCFARIKEDHNRPQVKLGESGLRALYQKRLPLYQKSDLILEEEEIKEIVSLESLVHNLEG